jgi:hypothetical protein
MHEVGSLEQPQHIDNGAHPSGGRAVRTTYKRLVEAAVKDAGDVQEL